MRITDEMVNGAAIVSGLMLLWLLLWNTVAAWKGWGEDTNNDDFLGPNG
jgi:hypothetical protein